MKAADFIDEDQLLEDLKKRDISAFAKLYKEYSEDLLILAFTLLGDATQSSQKVDELFVKLWEYNKFESITPPIHHYLYTEIRKACNSPVFSSN